MAIVQNPLIGESRKSVGNSTFSRWKDKNVLKAKPLSVANPKTPAQVAQRNKFSFIVSKATTIPQEIRRYFKEEATSMTEFNAFVKRNIGNVNITGGSNAVVDENLAVVASGSLPNVAVTAVGVATGTDVSVSWADNSDGITALSNDNVVLAAVNNETYDIHYCIDSYQRDGGSATFEFTVDVSAGDYTFHIFTYQESTKKSSDSKPA